VLPALVTAVAALAAPFAAGRVDLGTSSLRADLWLGLGEAHSDAFALELTPSLSEGGASVSLGTRLQLASLEARAGARYVFRFSDSWLASDVHFDEVEAESRRGERARYLAFDAAAKLEPMFGPGMLRLEVTATAIATQKSSQLVYEPSSRAIVAPPLVWTADAGYLLAVTSDASGRVGPVGELVGIPGRDAYLARAGLMLRWSVSDTLEVRGEWLVVFASPDDLGQHGGRPLEIAVRWRF
jgi:hypothetical protein